MFDSIITIIEVISIVLIADFFSGVAHWAQDRFDAKRLSFFNYMFIYKADEHHKHPSLCTQYTWFERNRYPVLILTMLAGSMFVVGMLTWKIMLFLTLLLFSGEIHVLSHHQSSSRNSLIRILKRSRLIQSSDHHRVHHKNHDLNYCIITNAVNPLLNRMGFFKWLDSMFVKSLKAQLPNH